MTMRSPSTSASSIEWVVMTITLSFLNCSMKDQTWRRFTGSIPVVGSSIKHILGSPRVEITTERRRFILLIYIKRINKANPPEYVLDLLSATFHNRTAFNRVSINFSRWILSTPLSPANNSMCSRAVNSSNRISCWGLYMFQLIWNIHIYLPNTHKLSYQGHFFFDGVPEH